MDCMRDDFEQGKLLDGRFLTISPLNHGSFGMVFSAKDMLTGNDVAIKCITKPTSAAEESNCPAAIATDEQSEELDIHSHLREHPNIVNLVHNFQSDNHQYMVLELCGNGDLYEAIRLGRGPLETEHVRDFMLQLVDAIDHIHAHGVFHRDIKPENIFLTASGSMKLGDFGLATRETWSTEFAVGSDRYMAPEQYDASVYGYGYSPAAADVWAIGIVLLNILFQRNPFATPTQKDPLFADFAADRQSLFDVFEKMSQDTFAVLQYCLALDPANRSLAGVREALNAVVSFTTDDESLDDFCTEQGDRVTATAGREPLRTPSVNSPAMGCDSFPWTSNLLKTPQKSSRQLSTIADEDMDMYPGSLKYIDTDASSLVSNLDSGLGMSYKSGQSTSSKPLSGFVGSLPISFTRPGNKPTPYGADGFSKSWSDLWDEEEEEMGQLEHRASFEAGMDISRVSTAKPASTPQNLSEGRGSVTPRQGLAELDVNVRAGSPMAKPIEGKPELKQRSSSIMDKWAALGNLRRKQESSATTPSSSLPASSILAPAPATPAPPKNKYTEAFASFTSFGASKKQKPQPPSRDRTSSTSWRQGSPTRPRAMSTHGRSWDRKDPSPTGRSPKESRFMNSNWRDNAAPPVPPLPSQVPGSATGASIVQQPKPLHKQKSQKSFLDAELADDGLGELEWVGGWHDLH
ncbi:hypothetical protein MBLNU230_g8227t1 [Neophaeotheca triangularis]